MAGLIKRQKVLLSVIDELQRCGRNTRTFIMKALFLLKKDFGADDKLRFYSFFPYKFGPFSAEVYADLNRLVKLGFLEESETALTPHGKAVVRREGILRDQTCLIAAKYKNKASLIDDVYARYPEYTVNSQLVNRPKEENSAALFATGYESEDIDGFLHKLVQNRIDIVIDIRDNPFSMKFAFTKSRLARHLERAGISYVHMKELGVERTLRQNLSAAGDYDAFFSAYRQKLGLVEDKLLEVVDIAGKQRAALLCFEKNPKRCHRSVLAAELEIRGTKVAFI